MSKVEGAKCTAIYDPVKCGSDSEKEVELCRHCSTMEALCTILIGCVIIASANYLHKEPVIAAAEANKHVFCEKPIALNYRVVRIWLMPAKKLVLPLWRVTL